MLPALLMGLGVALMVLWALANRRHLQRRERQSAEWDGGEERPDLWTSAAACVHCGASGGLLELVGDEVTFSCLACGRRHARKTKG